MSERQRLERERERERERASERDRQTDRETDRERDKRKNEERQTDSMSDKTILQKYQMGKKARKKEILGHSELLERKKSER